jgi:general secretion pathway protein G
MGEETGFRPFIVRDGRPDKRPNDDDAIYCSKQPADELQRRFGIGPVDDSNTSLKKILTDFNTLAAALGAYQKDMFALPNTADELRTLTHSDIKVSPPRQFRQGGYLKKLPKDPWGRAYLYESSRLGGVQSNYEIKTFGADGEPGGSAQNADVSTDQLDYLRHILATDG